MKSVKQIIITFAIIMLGSLNISAQNEKSIEIKNTLDLNIQKSEILKMFDSELLTNTAIIYSFSIVKNDETQKLYIVGIGKTKNDNSIIIRSEIKISQSSSNTSKFASVLEFTGQGESCTGDPCTHCWFAKGGGCGCGGTFSTGKCNHTVSK